MSQDLAPKWATLVVKPARLQLPDFADIKNALVYSDVVGLMPLDYVYSEGMLAALNDVCALKEIKLIPAVIDKLKNHQPFKLSEEVVISYGEFKSDLYRAGLSGVLAMSCVPGTVRREGSKPEFESDARFFEYAKCVQVIIDDDESNKARWQWEPYAAVNQFTSALSKIFLPDLGSLPLEGVAEMRDRLRPLLNPMRAELLRLSERLRDAIKDQKNAAEITSEAETLIKLRVEPIVREAGQAAAELTKKKWQRFYHGMVRVFGLSGAAFFRPDLLKDAVTEVLATGVALSESPETREPLGHTARFVLEARRFSYEKGLEDKVRPG